MTHTYYTNDYEALGSVDRMAIRGISLIQSGSGRLFVKLRNRIVRFFKLNDVTLDIARIEENKYIGATKFFQKLTKSLTEAEDVLMCVGELGHRMMERDDLINSLITASNENNARIRLVRGPRFDPDTQKILKLINSGAIEVVSLDKYPDDHFFLIREKNGKEVLFDEAPHVEPIRGLNEAGNRVDLYRSLYRPFYVIENPKFLGRLRAWQAEKRILRGKKTNEIVSKGERGYPFVWVLVKLLIVYLPFTFIIQPTQFFIEVVANTLDKAAKLSYSNNPLVKFIEDFQGLLFIQAEKIRSGNRGNFSIGRLPTILASSILLIFLSIIYLPTLSAIIILVSAQEIGSNFLN